MNEDIINKVYIKKHQLFDILNALPFEYIKRIDIDFISCFEYNNKTGKTNPKIYNLKINEPI